MRFQEAFMDELAKLAYETDEDRSSRLKRNYKALGGAIGSVGGFAAGAMEGKSTAGRLAKGVAGGFAGGAAGRFVGKRVGRGVGTAAQLSESNYSPHKEQD